MYQGKKEIDKKQGDLIRLIRMAEVRELTGLSRSYIYSLSADGLFPKSVALVPGGSSRAWVCAEVQDWLNGRVAERDMGGLS